MDARIEVAGEDILCRSGDGEAEYRLEGRRADEQLGAWARRYDEAVRRGDGVALLEIGRELFASLDQTGWGSNWIRSPGTRRLEIRVESTTEGLALALLEAPWELLAGREGYLADDAVQYLEVVEPIRNFVCEAYHEGQEEWVCRARRGRWPRRRPRWGLCLRCRGR